MGIPFDVLCGNYRRGRCLFLTVWRNDAPSLLNHHVVDLAGHVHRSAYGLAGYVAGHALV